METTAVQDTSNLILQTDRFTDGQKQRSRKFELLKYWCERNHLKQSETNIELMRMNKMLNPISKLTTGKGKLKHTYFYMLYTVGVFHNYCDHENRGDKFKLTYHSQ